MEAKSLPRADGTTGGKVDTRAVGGYESPMSFRPLLFLLLMTTPSFAQLRWEQTTRSFERAPGDPTVEAPFAFKNTGSTPVTIAKIKTSCGCTAAQLKKRDYAPGESGEVLAKFTIAGRRGLHVVSVTVTTDDDSQPPTTLSLRVNIADAVKLEPELVWWRVGAAPEAKSVRLEVEPGRQVRVKSITSSNPKIAAKLETLAAGSSYAILIRPADTASKESAEITVETDFPTDAPRRYVIYARIK